MARSPRLWFTLPSLLLCLAAQPALAAPGPVIAYPADVATPATFRLLPTTGNVGRDTPFYSNYRPQFWFSAEQAGITCAVQLPAPREKVEPGETADVVLRCLEGFRVLDQQRQFKVTQGGRLVGEGVLK